MILLALMPATLAPAADQTRRVERRFTEQATAITVAQENGFPAPGGRIEVFGRFEIRFADNPNHPLRGMWWRKITITKQASPTVWIGRGVGRTYTPHGTHRDKITNFTTRLESDGKFHFHGRIVFISGTGLYRRIGGAAFFEGVAAFGSSYPMSIRGHLSYNPTDG